MANTPVQIKAALGTEERPVSATEFKEFWMSLTNEEREYYKNAELS
jgi:hypothetical protein